VQVQEGALSLALAVAFQFRLFRGVYSDGFQVRDATHHQDMVMRVRSTLAVLQGLCS
jgi:hypothetical protein